MRVYVAAPWVRRNEAREAAYQLIEAGHVVTCRWLTVHGGDDRPERLRQEADNDLSDLLNSDIMLLLNLEKSEGKAVETGFAIATGMDIIAVGQPSNVFHYLPEVIWVDSVDEAIRVLRDESATTQR